MPFDQQRFMQARLEPRARAVKVPGLAEWFGSQEEAVWRVRGLTGNELATVNEAEARNKRESALLEAIQDGSRSELVAEFQKALGRGKDTKPDLARRLEMLRLASVEPECPEETAVKLAQDFPVVFYELTNTVLELTGRGAETEKKPSDSGETEMSGPVSA